MELAPEIAKQRILLVEDTMSMLHMIKSALRSEGFNNFVEASDGDKALAILQKKKVDLVICDWIMPRMSGLELFSAMKEDDRLVNIPFILLTGNDQKENVTTAFGIGIKHYIVKPFNPNKLFEKVVNLLQEKNEAHAALVESK